MNESYFKWFPSGNNFPQTVRVFYSQSLMCVNTAMDGKDITDMNCFFILPFIECSQNATSNGH